MTFIGEKNNNKKEAVEKHYRPRSERRHGTLVHRDENFKVWTCFFFTEKFF